MKHKRIKATFKPSFVDTTLFGPEPITVHDRTKVSIVSASALNTIRKKNQTKPPVTLHKYDQNVLSRKEQLRQEAAERAKCWPDTLSAKRKKKLERLHNKEAEDEKKLREDLRRMDEEKDYFQKKKLNEAYEKLRNRDERFDQINSAVLVSDVMEERKRQVEWKMALQEFQDRQEAIIDRQVAEHEIELNAREERDKQAIIDKSVVGKRALEEQLVVNETLRRKQTELELEEDRKYLAYLEEQGRLDDERKAAVDTRKRKFMEENIKFLEQRELFRQEERLRHEAEERRHKQLMEQRDEYEAAVKEFKAAEEEEKEKVRRREVERLSVILDEAKLREEGRVLDDVKEYEKYRDEAERAKQERLRLQRESIERGRQRQILKKQLREKHAREQKQFEKRELQRLADEYAVNDAEEQALAESRALQLKKDRLRQIERVNKRRRREKALDDAIFSNEQEEEEDYQRLLHAYGEDLIEQRKTQGLTVAPIQLSLGCINKERKITDVY
ncbi:hypothetical protein PCE1_002631 [Barthelona sp. PCE]